MASTKIINVVKDDTFDEILGLFNATPAAEVVLILPKKTKAFSKQAHFADLSAAARQNGKRLSILCSSPQLTAMARAYQFDIMSGSEPKPAKPKKKTAPVLASSMADYDDELRDDVRDDRDAFERDVQVPADETMGFEEEKQEKTPDELDDGMHYEEEGKTDDIETEDEAVTDDLIEEDKEKEPDPFDIDELEDEETADDVAVDESEPSYELRAASARTIDGMLAPPRSKDKRVPVGGRKERPLPVGIVKKPRREPSNLDELAQVWQQEDASKPLWSGVLNKRREGGTGTRFAGFFRKKAVLIGIAVLIFAGIVVSATDSSAHIVIKPAAKETDFTLQVSASDAYASPDPVFQKLPGQLFTITRSVTQNVTATGEKDVVQKARGKITVSNAYGTASQTLIATTRFQSPDGYVFRTLRTIIVPGVTVVNGVTTPGTVDVEIIADKAGQEYNIAPTTFTLPAFKEKGDLARYEKFSGKSATAMTGGMIGKARVVTDEDYAQAVTAVKIQLQREIQGELKSQSGGLVVPDTAAPQAVEIDSSAKPDEAAETFSVTAQGTLKAVGFKREDLDRLMRGYVERNYGLDTVPERLQVEIKNASYSEAKGSEELTIAVTGRSYAKIDQEKILTDLLGKKEDAIRSYLAAAEGVGSAKVVLSPFWISKMPQKKENIRVEISYE